MCECWGFSLPTLMEPLSEMVRSAMRNLAFDGLNKWFRMCFINLGEDGAMDDVTPQSPPQLSTHDVVSGTLVAADVGGCGALLVVALALVAALFSRALSSSGVR